MSTAGLWRVGSVRSVPLTPLRRTCAVLSGHLNHQPLHLYLSFMICYLPNQNIGVFLHRISWTLGIFAYKGKPLFHCMAQPFPCLCLTDDPALFSFSYSAIAVLLWVRLRMLSDSSLHILRSQSHLKTGSKSCKKKPSSQVKIPEALWGSKINIP